jgi:TPR repeat protein
MDARRLGHGPELPDALLRAAAPAYLSEAQRTAAGPDWFAQALAHAGTRVKGVVAPLGEVPDAGGMGPRPDVRRLADYLDHHGRTARSYVCPGAPFWEAAARGAGSAADLHELADSAYRRGCYAVADDLRRRAAEQGYAPAWTEMAHFREDRGCRAEAVELLWKGHAAGDTGALTTLAHWYLEDGDRDAALRLVPEIERTGDPQALLSLAQTPSLAGGDAEAERLARAAADLGDAEALTFLGRRRMLDGDGAAAEELYRRAVSAGDPAAAFELARMKLADEGDVAATVAAARQAAELGDLFTMGMMAQLVISIDPAEGRRMARQAADLGGVRPAQTVRLSAWENMVRQQGLAVLADHAERTQGDGAGEAVLRAAADAGDLHVMTWLAHRERQFGDPAEAEALYRAAAEGGYAPALLSLAWQRHEAGDDEEAERLCRTAVDAGEPRAVGALAQLWEKTGDRDGAGRLVLYGLNPDGTPTTPWLPLREGHEPAMGHYAVKGWIEIRRAD